MEPTHIATSKDQPVDVGVYRYNDRWRTVGSFGYPDISAVYLTEVFWHIRPVKPSSFILDQLLAEHVSKMFVGKRMTGLKFAGGDVHRRFSPVVGLEVVSAILTTDEDNEQVVMVTFCDGSEFEVYGNDEVTLEEKI